MLWVRGAQGLDVASYLTLTLGRKSCHSKDRKKPESLSYKQAFNELGLSLKDVFS